MDIHSDNKGRTMDRLNTSDAAEFLGVAPESLKRSRWSGVLWGRPAPAFVKEGRGNVRYLRSTLEEWLQGSKEYTSTAAYQADREPESVTES